MGEGTAGDGVSLTSSGIFVMAYGGRERCPFYVTVCECKVLGTKARGEYDEHLGHDIHGVVNKYYRKDGNVQNIKLLLCYVSRKQPTYSAQTFPFEVSI